MANLSTLKINDASFIDIIYPVGSIYETLDESFNPNIAFGGMWERIEGRFLFGAGNLTAIPNSINSYGELNPIWEATPVGETAGQFTHVLTIAEMPSHNHNVMLNKGTDDSNFTSVGNEFQGGDSNAPALNTTYIQSTGGSGGHNNMPPYLAICIWKRVG